MTLLVTLWIILTVSLIALPIFRLQRAQCRRELLDAFRRFQKDLVRARYPALREYTDSELEQLFDIDELYRGI